MLSWSSFFSTDSLKTLTVLFPAKSIFWSSLTREGSRLPTFLVTSKAAQMGWMCGMACQNVVWCMVAVIFRLRSVGRVEGPVTTGPSSKSSWTKVCYLPHRKFCAIYSIDESEEHKRERLFSEKTRMNTEVVACSRCLFIHTAPCYRTQTTTNTVHKCRTPCNALGSTNRKPIVSVLLQGS